MLDLFAIFSKSGIVLFTAIQNTLTSNLQSYLNRLIRNVILEDRIDKLQIDTLLLQFYLDNEFEFVYVIGYQKMLTLSYLDKFLNDIQLKFRDKYLRNGRNVADIRNLQFIFNDIGQNELKNNPRIAQKNLGENFLDQNIEYLPTNLIDFVNEFRQIYFACYRYHQQHGSSSSSGDQPHEMRTFEQSQKSKKTVASMIIKSSKNPQQPAPPPVVKNDSKSMKNGPENADNGRNNDNTDGTLSKDEILKKLASKSAKLGSPKAKKPQAVKDGKAKKVKKPTVWDFNGGATTTGGNRIDSNLDFSKKLDDGEDGTSSSSSVLRNMVDMNDQDLNDMQPDLDFEVSDDDDDEVNEGYKQQPQQSSNPKKSGFFGSLMNQFSYNKTLSKADLDPILSTLRDHLIAKNVAAEIAQKLCDSVATKLIGQNVNTWISLKQFVRNALEESILRILSPNRNLNILREIQMKNNSPMNESSTKQPYVIVFCGVNGVGKSTNLAKIANWLLLNDKNVLVIACDTFRAGAIEQLRTHIRALKNLHEKSASKIDLYEKGYGKDSTGIAMEGIRYASNNGYDVCLVDTAGRMQGNEPLMKQLAKLIKVNEPDLTLFVGEALVGNEAVDQLVNFNRSLLDNGCRSATNDSQSAINGIVLTKFDTIDDQVGAAISMTYITGQPIVFVGVGQTYRDLKQLNAKAVVRALMK